MSVASRALAQRALRAWFGATDRLAPRLAERHAARVFLTPLRRPRAVPHVPHVPARPLAVPRPGGPLVGWSWGDGPTVLLVHGWSGRAADLSGLAAAVVGAGFRAVAFDMPAHGHSPGRRTSLAEWRHLLPTLGRELAAGGADGGALHAVVAHSFGATATVLALADGLQARGVVLLAPARGPHAFLDRVRRHIGLPRARVAGMEREVVRLVGRELGAFDAADAARDLTARGLAVPAHILHDPGDAEVPWDHAAAIAAAWRGSRLQAVPGVGHYGVLRAPSVAAQVGGLMTSFGRAEGR